MPVYVPIMLGLITLLATAAVVLITRRHGKRTRTTVSKLAAHPHTHYAFIINPSKPQAAELRRRIAEFCSQRGLNDVEYLETQLDRDGAACAHSAIDHGADVIVAAGGDGTVRTVASAVAKAGRTMGIIPIGTGNLFARNVGIPLDSEERALEVATSPHARSIDMGRVELLDSDEPGHRHGFLIVAGIGFDARMIEDTDPRLKKNLSWLAYFIGGMKNLFAPRHLGDITITDANGRERVDSRVAFRTFLAGNCGQIPAFTLMPEADYADGMLDFETMNTTGGLIGWINLFADVVHQTITHRAQQSPLSTHSQVWQMQGSCAEIRLDRPALAQVDGDVLGETQHIAFTIDHRALNVRTPSES